MKNFISTYLRSLVFTLNCSCYSYYVKHFKAFSLDLLELSTQHDKTNVSPNKKKFTQIFHLNIFHTNKQQMTNLSIKILHPKKNIAWINIRFGGGV